MTASNAEVIRALTLAKAEFQLRTLALILGAPRDSDAVLGTKPEGLSPEGAAARAEGIAQPPLPSPSNRNP